VNAAVLAVGATALVVSPATVSANVIVQEVVILTAGVAVLLLVNVYLVRRALAPLDRMSSVMQRTNLLEPDEALDPSGPAEIHELVSGFEEMLDRLQRERRASGRRALAAQENERKRVAQELHDEIGQSLTAVKLQLHRLERRVSGELRPDVREAQEEIDRSLGDVRRIAMRLRPEALDDLGLVPALTALTVDMSRRTGLEIARRIDQELPPLGADRELVVFRVAQEALTNVARHADARRALLRLERTTGGARLTVSDDGTGLAGSSPGSGIDGMRERALLVDGTFTIGASGLGGTEVRLEVPGET
jgi:two-component system sensor histidine kinase UhpB